MEKNRCFCRCFHDPLPRCPFVSLENRKHWLYTLIIQPAAQSSQATGPLINRIWAVDEQNNLVRHGILALAGVILLTLSAKVSVPFYPVPMTLQTLAVLLIGAAYGWRLGMITVVLYLAQGFFGAPVFANTPPAVAGPLYFMGPTAGFLMGFILSAGIVGYAVEKGASDSLLKLAGVMLLAQVVVFTLGYLWLGFFASLANGATGVGAARAWSVIQTFMLGDLLKTGIAVMLVSVFARKTAR
jgi:biotin transport system substrate-specific component